MDLLKRQLVTNKLRDQSNSGRICLQLYVTGMTARSMAAIRNIRHICDKHFKDRFDLEVIDLYKTPEAAAANQIVFSPSLIKISPAQKRIIIGTFSDADQVLKTLNIGMEQ